MSNFLAVAIAIFLDRLFGELTIYHPIKGFARLATYIEDHWHRQENITRHSPATPDSPEPDKPADGSNRAIETMIKIQGALAAALLILPFVALAGILSQTLPTPLDFVFNVLVLYLAIGAHSLKQHAIDVQNALVSDNIELARKHIAALVNRDVQHLDRQEITSTTIESVLENGSESILAPIFWFLVFGAPGAVLYRLVHTLHTMWGYQSSHYKNFGMAVARVNNILNWIPARLTAFSYMILADMKNGWRCFNEQAKTWNSPNVELTVATGAGALNLEVGGDIYYQGELKKRPKLGTGKIPDLSDISRSCDLVERSMILWLAFILVVSLGH